MSEFLLNTIFREHHNFPEGEDIPTDLATLLSEIIFKNQEEKKCVYFDYDALTKLPNKIHTSYYVGTDWLNIDEGIAIYIEPKLNDANFQTDYLRMFLDCLEHPVVGRHIQGLYEIKFTSPTISIHQNQDLLTPLLIIHFLNIVKEIVRKGLKKSFYKINQNLNSKIKGKLMISKTIKQNIFKNKLYYSYCQFEDFGFNNPENKMLKKALLFVRRYLTVLFQNHSQGHLEEKTLKTLNEIFNYIFPAFQTVDSDIELNELKVHKNNIFFKEYGEGIRLAKWILKRFGYNINSIEEKENVNVPPFWIDMSKLFELYVFTKLTSIFGSSVFFQASGEYGNPDFLIKHNDLKMIVDAKYKSYYLYGFHKCPQLWMQENIIKDIRQISGYSRDRKISTFLELNPQSVIDCLIIYPNEKSPYDLSENILTKDNQISEFISFYKCGIRLPKIKE